MFSIKGIIQEGYKLLKEKKEPIVGAITHPSIACKFLEIRKHIYTSVADLSAEVAVTDEPVPFGTRLTLDYKPIAPKEPWGSFFQCAWFKFSGRLPESCKDKPLAAFIDIGGEGCIYDENGAPQLGITGVLSAMDFFGSAKGKHIYRLPEYTEKLEIWLDAGNNGFSGVSTGFAKLNSAHVVTINEPLLKLYYDYFVLFVLMTTVKEDSERYDSIFKGLKSVCKILKKYTDTEIAEADKVLSPLLAQESKDEFELFAVGHAHLDLAWLWPIRETKRKAARTFSNQLFNISKYDNYVFGASQPQQFEWAKELYPDLYKRIKQAVKDKRLEPQGGMWVEPDTNVTGAESLVRQVLYGKRFFNEEFGQDMRILWLPDVFGFSGALPQIMKKTGMDYFLTIKLNWNKINVFPHHSFKWAGIDSSEVIVHMPPDGTYNSEGSPLSVQQAYKKYKNKETNCALMLYGVGDGGGGPGEGHIEALSRAQNLNGLKKVRFAPAIEFFDRLKEKENTLPKVHGELYLETHQGTLTTQANNKKLNRCIETALRNTELLATIASRSGFAYPKAQLDKIWKEVLLYQFHDIIPGSSINRVYVESIARYNEMLAELENLVLSLIAFLAKDKKGKSVINTLPYSRTEYLKIDNAWHKAAVKPFASASPELVTQTFSAITAGPRYIENDKLRVFFARDGSIKALFEKCTNRNFAGDYLNRLTVYKDIKTFYDAWDIDINYTKRIKRYFRLVSFENIIDGPTVIRRNHYKYNNSTITQDVMLTCGGDTVNFVTEVDWRESHKMLRADFRPSVYSDKALFNIQWGNIERSTKTNTPIEYAQHEVAAHKFVQVQSAAGGFALLNDCKYGHRVKDGLISLNLLRSPDYPDETADRGVHRFTYAVYASSAKDFTDNTIERSYLLNMPLIATDYKLEIASEFVCDAPNIIIETVKLAENGSGTVIRLYESAGRAVTASVTPDFAYSDAFECDMLERSPQKTDLKALNFTPYEIKTILIKEKTK